MNLTELITGFILGVFSSLVASWIYKLNEAKQEKKMYTNLAGLWIERIDGQENRRFSIADFRYDQTDGKFHYNGINFNNDSTIYYRWRSERIFKDTDRDRLLYIYSVSENGIIYTHKEGFGVTYFNQTKNDCYFTYGYFLNADLNAEPRNMKLIKADKLAKKYSFDLADKTPKSLSKFVKRLVEIEETSQMPCF